MAAMVEDEEVRAVASQLPRRGVKRPGTPLWALAVSALLWCYAFAKVRRYDVELLQLFVVLSGFGLVGFLLWRKRGNHRAPGQASAYAFLNEDGRRLPGDMTLSAFGLPEVRSSGPESRKMV